jgi:hypothetical protein
MHNRFECVKQKGKPHGRKSSGGSIIQYPKLSNYCSSSSDTINGYMTSDNKRENKKSITGRYNHARVKKFPSHEPILKLKNCTRLKL